MFHPDSCIVVLNPTSGSASNSLIDGLNTRLAHSNQSHANWPVIETTPDLSWTKQLQAELSKQNYKTVFMVGGDGTATQVGSILQHYPHTSLFIVPAGRGNDLVRVLYGYNKSENFWLWFEKCSKNWIQKPIDVISSSGRIFLNMASLGYGGEVVEKAVGRRAFWSKWSSVYKIEGTIAYFRYPETFCRVEVDGVEQFKGKFFGAFVGNGQANASGLYWTKDAKLDDGKLNVMVFGKPTFFGMLKSTFNVKEQKLPTFQHLSRSASEVTFLFDVPVPLELDGDYIGVATRYTFDINPKKLKIWAPQVEENSVEQKAIPA